MIFSGAGKCDSPIGLFQKPGLRASETPGHRHIDRSVLDFAKFIIGPAEGRTQGLNPASDAGHDPAAAMISCRSS
jgi:hypothetical protein